MEPKQKDTAQDITFKGFVKDNASNMFGIDGRLWITLKLLLFHPGKLTKAWLEGGQSQFTSPTTLYFTSNFLFFFLQPIVNTGKIRLLSFGYEGFMATEGLYRNWIREDLAKSGLSELVYQVKFDAFITYNQPALIFIMIPFLTMFIWLMELKSGKKLIHHTVHAFHFMTFFLILFLSIAGVTNIIAWSFPAINHWLFPIALIFLFLLQVIYWGLSIHQLRGHFWGISVLKSIVMTVALNFLLWAYVQVLLFWTIFNVG